MWWLPDWIRLDLHLFYKMGRPCINRGRSATKQSDEEQDYSKWDPVKWFSQRGYNVTQMIHAPGKKIEKNPSIV